MKTGVVVRYAAFVGFLLQGCGVGSASAVPSAAIGQSPSEATAPLAESTPLANQARYVGRVAFDGNSQARFAWPNVAIGVNFKGTGLSAQLGDLQNTTANGQVAHNSFDVAVDGNTVQTIQMTVGLSSYTLVSNLPSGNHTVWLTKRGEAIVGTALLGGFTVSGGQLMTPPAARAHTIEWYGDSNETGYGDLASVTAANMCSFSSQTEDAAMDYPQLIANALSADLINISYAGKGIYQNAFPQSDPNAMPAIYDLIDPNDPTVGKWAFTEQQPDMVAIDLGGNDFNSATPSSSAFITAYTNFLKTLRSKYPHAHFIALMGPMVTGTQRDDMSSWIATAIKQSGDNETTFYAFPLYSGSTFGCDYHPSEALLEQMASQLQPQVKATF